MKPYKITVIMPTLNSEKTILTPLTALLAQTYQNFELILVDGGSIDRTLEIVLEQFPFVRIITQKEKGIWNAINLGIQNASGDIIHILNSDDYISPFSLNEIVNAFSKDEECEALWLPSYSAAGFLNSVNTSKLKYGMHKFSPGHSASFFVLKSIHERIGLYDEKIIYCADHEFYWRLKKNGINYSIVKNHNAYGVFTFGGFSSTNPYKSKVLEEFNFRKKSSSFDDIFYCGFITPLKIIWSLFK